jgi:putative redox protein
MDRYLTFKGSQGHDLSARLDQPEDKKPRAYILFAHCFTCGKDVIGASNIAKALVKEGYAVLRFDFTGLGSSGGDFANTNFSSNIADLICAADFMRETLQAPQLLIGHSLGGAAVLVAARSIPEINAVATIGAPSDSDHVTETFACDVDKIMEDGEAEICLVGRPFTIKKQFLEDLQSQDMAGVLQALNKPLLVLHAPTDQVVGIENASQIFSIAKHPKSFISLDTADHLLSKRDDAFYAASAIAGWVERYIK